MSAALLAVSVVMMFVVCESGDSIPLKSTNDGNEITGGDNCNGGESGNIFTDPRDCQRYRTVQMGTQVWMARNLNYVGWGGFAGRFAGMCYRDSTDYCDAYGRLYNFATALRACPAGWHLPTAAEWQKLAEHVDPDYLSDDQNNAGKELRAADGFSALPGGYLNIGPGSCNSDGCVTHTQEFYNAGSVGYWWSASTKGTYDINGSFAYIRTVSDDPHLSLSSLSATTAFASVRCVRDTPANTVVTNAGLDTLCAYWPRNFSGSVTRVFQNEAQLTDFLNSTGYDESDTVGYNMIKKMAHRPDFKNWTYFAIAGLGYRYTMAISYGEDAVTISNVVYSICPPPHGPNDGIISCAPPRMRADVYFIPFTEKPINFVKIFKVIGDDN